MNKIKINRWLPAFAVFLLTHTITLAQSKQARINYISFTVNEVQKKIIIDWAIDNKNYPTFKVSNTPASNDFYKSQAQAQKLLMSQPPTHSTLLMPATTNSSGTPNPMFGGNIPSIVQLASATSVPAGAACSKVGAHGWL